jgi:hypothetical protein
LHDMITTIYANSKKDLERRLEEIKAQHISINPGKEITVNVLNPNPDEVYFNDHNATGFTIGVKINRYDEDEDQ